MNDWQVIFFNNVPVWQFGNLIRVQESPSGPTPSLMCTTVHPVLNGFLELTIASGADTPELTVLARADHVLCARRMREPNSFGFAVPAPSSAPAIPT